MGREGKEGELGPLIDSREHSVFCLRMNVLFLFSIQGTATESRGRGFRSLVAGFDFLCPALYRVHVISFWVLVFSCKKIVSGRFCGRGHTLRAGGFMPCLDAEGIAFGLHETGIVPYLDAEGICIPYMTLNNELMTLRFVPMFVDGVSNKGKQRGL